MTVVGQVCPDLFFAKRSIQSRYMRSYLIYNLVRPVSDGFDRSSLHLFISYSFPLNIEQQHYPV